MMSIRIDWEKLRNIHNDLSESMNAEEEILFTLLMDDGSAKRASVKFKDFMNFFWSLSENSKFSICAIVVQDIDGRILYRHKQVTRGNEEVPIGGNENIILRWPTFTQEEKELLVRITIAQINGYER